MPKFYIFSIFLLLSSTFLYAFDHPFIQYNFNYLTEDNGLTHNFVDDIYKDSHGYLWFATHNGLTRYDGYNFLSYNTTTTPVNLKGDLVYNICEDNFKRLWIATEKGIDIIDLEIYCNAELTIDLYSTMWNMMNTSATHIYKDTAGNLWISAANNLYCIEFHENGEIKDFYGLEKGISSTSINAVADLGWGVCAGINNCLMCLEKNSEHLLKTKMVSPLFSNQYDDWKIQSLEADDEDLWIGTNYGLYKYNHFDQQLIEYNNLKDKHLCEEYSIWSLR